MHAGAHRIRLHKQVVTVKNLFPRSLNVPCRPRGRLCEKGKFVDSTTTANETPHMHVHACRCAGVCVCVCKGSLYALPAGVSSCKTCRRAYPAGYRALEAGLDRESRKTACLIDPLRAELMARVQSSRGALTPLVSPSTQRSRLSALIGPSMCLQGANNTTTKNCTAFPPLGREKKGGHFGSVTILAQPSLACACARSNRQSLDH